MTAQPSQPSMESAHCPLCGTPVGETDERCRDCGHALAGIDGRAKAYSRAALLWTIAGFFAVYLVTIAIVAATR